LSPGTRRGPRTFSWFKTVVDEYFEQKRNREVVFALPSANNQKPGILMSQDELDAMTDAFETN
jgi:hypothetical protein